MDLRERLSVEVREILEEGMTAVLVTHDQHEAFAMADEIGVMSDGRIQQWDTPYNLYHRPVTASWPTSLARGCSCRARCLTTGGSASSWVLSSGVPVECSRGCQACGRGCAVEVLLRPDDVVHDDSSPTRAEVRYKAFRGAGHPLHLAPRQRRGGALPLVPSHHNHALGEQIGVRLEADHVDCLPPRGLMALSKGAGLSSSSGEPLTGWGRYQALRMQQ